jgi:hypothetical protein
MILLFEHDSWGAAELAKRSLPKAAASTFVTYLRIFNWPNAENTQTQIQPWPVSDIYVKCTSFIRCN